MLFLIIPYFSPVWEIIHTVSIPFLISMIIAYLLHPLVDVLMKFKLGRTLSILLIYIFFLGGVTLLLWLVAPIFITQIKEVLQQLPELERTLYHWSGVMEQQLKQLPDGVHQGVDDALGKVEQGTRQTMESVLEAMGSLIGNLFVLIVVPFLVFYLLNDVEVIQKSIYFFVPRKQRKPAVKLWKDIDHSLGEYIRGQIIISVIVGILSLIGYYFIGLPYVLFLSVIVAISNIIPYFGPFIGAAPAVIVALITEPSLVLWVIVINTIIQVIEGNVLAPWIMGRRLHIHPIFIIFALLIGAELGGLLGLILAVPIFVVLKLVILNTVLHLREYKKAAKS
jgi:predicted PurR-regulated permease PerM